MPTTMHAPWWRKSYPRHHRTPTIGSRVQVLKPFWLFRWLGKSLPHANEVGRVVHTEWTPSGRRLFSVCFGNATCSCVTCTYFEDELRVL